jgi:hypothetical protein
VESIAVVESTSRFPSRIHLYRVRHPTSEPNPCRSVWPHAVSCPQSLHKSQKNAEIALSSAHPFAALRGSSGPNDSKWSARWKLCNAENDLILSKQNSRKRQPTEGTIVSCHDILMSLEGSSPLCKNFRGGKFRDRIWITSSPMSSPGFRMSRRNSFATLMKLVYPTGKRGSRNRSTFRRLLRTLIYTIL